MKVFEDDIALAFMDIFPQSRGHALVIPKNVKRAQFSRPADRVGGSVHGRRVQRVARAVETALKPDGVVVTQFNGAPAGQTIFHVHFHIIPRWENMPLQGHSHDKRADLDDLQTLAREIAAAL